MTCLPRNPFFLSSHFSVLGGALCKGRKVNVVLVLFAGEGTIILLLFRWDLVARWTLANHHSHTTHSASLSPSPPSLLSLPQSECLLFLWGVPPLHPCPPLCLFSRSLAPLSLSPLSPLSPLFLSAFSASEVLTHCDRRPHQCRWKTSRPWCSSEWPRR